MEQINPQPLFLDTHRIRSDLTLLSILSVMLAMTIVQFYVSEAFADSNSAGISYRSNTGTGTTQAPKYREWNAATLSWSAETVLSDTGSPIRFAWLEYSAISTKRVIVTLSDDGTLNAFTCSSACTSAANWAQQSDFADVWSTAPTGAQRPFDFEFERTSGDLVVVYDKVSTVAAQDLFYRVMPAGSNQFGAEGTIDNSNTLLSADTVYSFARLSSKQTAGTNDLAMIALDETNADAIAWIWNASTDTWGTEKTITLLASIGTEEAVGIAHETSSGDIIAVAGSSASMFYCEFTGSTWCIAPSTFGPVAIGTINWVTIKADPVASSNALFVAETGSSSDLDTQYWSGSTWTDHAEHDAAIDSHATRVVDFGWDNTGSQGVLIWGTASGTLSYKTFTGTSTFGLHLTFTETGTHPWVQMADYPNPTSGDTLSSLGTTLDSTFDIGGIRWDGGILTAPVSTGDGGITADTTVTTFENFKVAWQRSGSAPTWSQAVNESVGVSDGQAKNPAKNVSENLGLSDTLQAIGAFLQELNESLALTDSRTLNAGRRLDESVALSYTTAFSSSRSFSENLSLTDSGTTTTLFSSSLSENLAAADQFTVSTSKFIIENTGLSDGIGAASDILIPLSESLSLADSISDVFIDFQLELGESIAMIISFFTPVVGYQSSLVSEGIGVADTVEFGSQYSVGLNESLAVQDSITPQKHSTPEEAETDPDPNDARGGRGGRGSGGSIPDEEPSTGEDNHQAQGKDLQLGVSETIRLQSEENISRMHSDRVEIGIYATLHGISTSYQLIPPAAMASVTFTIDNNGSSTERVIIEYWYIDEKSGVKIFERTQEFLSAPHQPVLESADIPFLSPGEYSVIASVKTVDDNKIQDTTGIDITVPPIAVYLNVLIALVVGSAASTGGYIFWITRRKRIGKYNKDGAPL